LGSEIYGRKRIIFARQPLEHGAVEVDGAVSIETCAASGTGDLGQEGIDVRRERE